jgi:hypothetical protein
MHEHARDSTFSPYLFLAVAGMRASKGRGAAPHPCPLPEGRGPVKLCPLRRRSRGERAPVKLGALCRHCRREREDETTPK